MQNSSPQVRQQQKSNVLTSTAIPPTAVLSDKIQIIPLIQQLEQARGNIKAIVYWIGDSARMSEA